MDRITFATYINPPFPNLSITYQNFKILDIRTSDSGGIIAKLSLNSTSSSTKVEVSLILKLIKPTSYLPNCPDKL